VPVEPTILNQARCRFKPGSRQGVYLEIQQSDSTEHYWVQKLTAVKIKAFGSLISSWFEKMFVSNTLMWLDRWTTVAYWLEKQYSH